MNGVGWAKKASESNVGLITDSVNSDLSVKYYFSNGLFCCSGRTVKITCQDIDQSTQKAGKKPSAYS